MEVVGLRETSASEASLAFRCSRYCKFKRDKLKKKKRKVNRKHRMRDAFFFNSTKIHTPAVVEEALRIFSSLRGALGYLGLRCGGRRRVCPRSLLTAHKKSIKYKLLAHRLALYNHPQRKHTTRRSVCGAEADVECLSSSPLLPHHHRLPHHHFQAKRLVREFLSRREDASRAGLNVAEPRPLFPWKNVSKGQTTTPPLTPC